jgi:hypothetical protein
LIPDGRESKGSTYNCIDVGKEISQTSTDYTGINGERDREMIGHRQLQRQARRERVCVCYKHTDRQRETKRWVDNRIDRQVGGWIGKQKSDRISWGGRKPTHLTSGNIRIRHPQKLSA